MEHLTKQQIVLLTLLVSFVTSISTGIVTVSLMDQAPEATHTISQIIEKTVEQAAPQNASVGVVSISIDDQIASSTASVESSLVKIQQANTGTVVGIGVLDLNRNIVITDPTIVTAGQFYTALLSDGEVVPLNQNSFTLAHTPVMSANINIVSTSSLKLGQKVFALTGTTTTVLGDGIITELLNNDIGTSIDTHDFTPGSILFDIQGNLIGILSSGIFVSISAPISTTTSVQ